MIHLPPISSQSVGFCVAAVFWRVLITHFKENKFMWKGVSFYLPDILLTRMTKADPFCAAQLFLGSHLHLKFTWKKLHLGCESASLGIIHFKKLWHSLVHLLYILRFLHWLQVYLLSGSCGQTHSLLLKHVRVANLCTHLL